MGGMELFGWSQFHCRNWRFMPTKLPTNRHFWVCSMPAKQTKQLLPPRKATGTSARLLNPPPIEMSRDYSLFRLTAPSTYLPPPPSIHPPPYPTQHMPSSPVSSPHPKSQPASSPHHLKKSDLRSSLLPIVGFVRLPGLLSKPPTN